MAKNNIIIDWNQVFLKYGESLTRRDVCKALNISFSVLDNARKKGVIRESPLPGRMITFSMLEVKRYAEEVLGYKSAIIKDDDNEKKAKRFELRKRIYKILNSDKPYWDSRIDFDWNELERVFNWIYESPMIEWEGKIYCFAEIFKEDLAIDYIILKSTDLYNKLK